MGFIDIAPELVFSRFKRLNNWVVGLIEVFLSVFVFRAIATAYVATGAANSQVNLAIACLEAFLTASSAGHNILNLVGMGTG